MLSCIVVNKNRITCNWGCLSQVLIKISRVVLKKSSKKRDSLYESLNSIGVLQMYYIRDFSASIYETLSLPNASTKIKVTILPNIL